MQHGTDGEGEPEVSFAGAVTESDAEGEADGGGVWVVEQPKSVATSNRAGKEKRNDLENR
jgi:hypothetical protein